jgi:hypothetical protein
MITPKGVILLMHEGVAAPRRVNLGHVALGSDERAVAALRRVNLGHVALGSDERAVALT